MPPDQQPDDTRRLRRAPAIIALLTTASALLIGIPTLAANARDHLINAGATTLWAVGTVVLIASSVLAVKLLRTRDRQRQGHLAIATFIVWLVGAGITIYGRRAWGAM
ncbi:hypothetical protein [Dactylosporangium sp. CA-139066]|uniref:hypothetical protein n=1 Tax=Dactylosporangium sp. CA-139066 TaxID=3239930 RepID=UPI003D93E3CD